MANITTGTGCTFTGTTIEKQLWQQIHHWQNSERTSTEDDRFTSSKDDTFIMSGTFNIPGTLLYNPTSGLFSPATIPYLPTIVFSAGSPLGTIKGLTFAQYFIDTCQYIILWQNNEAKNPNSKYNLSMNFNYSSLQYSGEFSLPYSVSLGSDGSIVETVTDWLVT